MQNESYFCKVFRLLTLSNVVDGNQQTAQRMCDDILKQPLPISTGPEWGVPEGGRLGIEVDDDKLHHYYDSYRQNGQFLPYDPALV